MAERNRVTPDGRIVATAVRGAWMGNRGRLHRPGPDHEIVRTHQTRNWITCVLEFRGRRVPQWDPRHYTPLFFRDEAVAFAAGHRPCAECRHAAYTTYRDAWAAAEGRVPYARDMDDRLHAERGREHALPWTEVPTGAFVVDDGGRSRVVDARQGAGVAVGGVGDLGDLPRDLQQRALVVVGDEHRAGEADPIAAHRGRVAAGPPGDQPPGQRHGQHAVRYRGVEADLLGDLVVPVDRVQVARDAGVVHQVLPGQRNDLLGKWVAHLHRIEITQCHY